jgi:hypothetical protein
MVVQLRLRGPSENAMSQELLSEEYPRKVLEPTLDVVQMFHRDRVYVYRYPVEIFENHN